MGVRPHKDGRRAGNFESQMIFHKIRIDCDSNFVVFVGVRPQRMEDVK